MVGPHASAEGQAGLVAGSLTLLPHAPYFNSHLKWLNTFQGSE